MNTVPKINPASVQRARDIAPAEWDTRVDLAACYRLVDLYGMTDLHLNHISARVPGSDEHFLINPLGMMYEEITASSLIKIDLAGNIVANANPEYGINLPGYVIHSAIHRARHDVACVLHTHTNAGMAVSVLKCGLLPLTQTAMRWPRIAYHDFEGVVVDLDEQKRLVDNLGDSEVMILAITGSWRAVNPSPRHSTTSIASSVHVRPSCRRWPATARSRCRRRKSSPARTRSSPLLPRRTRRAGSSSTAQSSGRPSSGCSTGGMLPIKTEVRREDANGR